MSDKVQSYKIISLKLPWNIFPHVNYKHRVDVT